MPADAQAHPIAQHAPIVVNVNIVMREVRVGFVHGQSHRRVRLHHLHIRRVYPPLIQRLHLPNNNHIPVNARLPQKKAQGVKGLPDQMDIAGSMGVSLPLLQLLKMIRKSQQKIPLQRIRLAVCDRIRRHRPLNIPVLPQQIISRQLDLPLLALQTEE